MNDITIIYYTANLVEEPFATNIRNQLLSWLPKDTPIISVSHKPMGFGMNICMPDLEVSIYNIYIQVLAGARAAETKYVMCMEDDALYNLEHFQYRPADDAFAYNRNKWMANEDCFFYRDRINMSMCVAPTKLMVDTLVQRFERFPKVMTREEMGVYGFGEPGKFEDRYGLPTVKVESFRSTIPTLTFNHRPSVGGVRKITSRDKIVSTLPHWGKASDLWKGMYDGRT